MQSYSNSHGLHSIQRSSNMGAPAYFPSSGHARMHLRTYIPVRYLRRFRSVHPIMLRPLRSVWVCEKSLQEEEEEEES